jgi:signal peptidase I
LFLKKNNNTEDKTTASNKRGILKKYLFTLLITFILALLIRGIILEAYKIPTGSMENTLLPGDFILVNKTAYSISTPRIIPILNIEIPQIELIKMDKPMLNG